MTPTPLATYHVVIRHSATTESRAAADRYAALITREVTEVRPLLWVSPDGLFPPKPGDGVTVRVNFFPRPDDLSAESLGRVRAHNFARRLADLLDTEVGIGASLV
jgi:hypothetical protein